MSLGLNLCLWSEKKPGQIIPTDLYVWAGGQSNIGYEFTQYSASGSAAFSTESALYFPGTIQYRNKSVGGSSLSEWVSSGVLQTYGTAMLTDMAANPPSSGAAIVIRWNWGEQNGADGLSKATIKTECLALFQAWRAEYPALRIFIDMLGDRATNVNETYWQNVKDAYLELISENSWIYKGAEHYDQDLIDNQHYVENAYIAQAQRAARRIASSYNLRTSQGTLGPAILSAAIVSPSVIEVSLDHDDGIDFTPTSAIEGIDVLIDGTAQTTPTVTQKDASTLRLLLAEGEAPKATEATVIYNNYGQQVGLDKTKVVRDNAGTVMPLQTGKSTAVNSDPVQALDNLIIYINPRGCAKTYNTGARIETITPIGGAITSAVGPVTATEGPTYDGTAFENAGGFTFDDVDRDLLVGDLGTAGTAWTIGMVWEFAATLNYAYYFFGWGASGGATDAQTLAFMSNTGLIRYSTNESNAIETIYDANVLAGTRNIMFWEYVSASELNLYLVIAGAVTKVGTINPRDDYTAYDYMLFFNSSASRIAAINDKCGAFFITKDILTANEKNNIAVSWDEEFSAGVF